MTTLLPTIIAWRAKLIWSEDKRKIIKRCKGSFKNSWKRLMSKQMRKLIHSIRKSKKSKNSNTKLSKSRTSMPRKGLKLSRSSRNSKRSTSRMPIQAILPQANSGVMNCLLHLLLEIHKLLTLSLCSNSDSKRSSHQIRKN